jgi:hypothetical protein
MSDSENFATRWSRLKRKANEKKPEPSHERHRDAEGEAARNAEDVPAPERHAQPDAQQEEPAFDPATLPPIDSIVAGTDIRAFLQSGVPAELAKAALRRAWTADPAIRDFIEMAENQWDFTNPASIPGFGPLLPGDDTGQLVAQAMGKLAEATKSEPANPEAGQTKSDTRVATASPAPSHQVSGIPEGSAETSEACPPVKVDTPAEFAASQHVDLPVSRGKSNRRGHGRALPK